MSLLVSLRNSRQLDNRPAPMVRMLPNLAVVRDVQPRQVTDCPMCGYTWPACGCRL